MPDKIAKPRGRPKGSTKPLRKCNRCKDHKPHEEFYGAGRLCKPCNTVDVRERTYEKAFRRGSDELLALLGQHIACINSAAKVLRQNGISPKPVIGKVLDM